MNTTLINLYQRMADLTVGECAQCRAPFSCCSPEYCDLATARAAEFNVNLTRGDHPTLPYMIDGIGCTVPPYLRVLCTLHTCAINSHGFKAVDPGWTRRYFVLRDQIEDLELKRACAAADGERTAINVCPEPNEKPITEERGLHHGRSRE